MKKLFLGFVFLTALTAFAKPALAAPCRNSSNGAAGAIIGGIIGGVIGHQIGSGNGNTAATIIGAIGGAIVGGELGCEMGEPEYREINYVRTTYFDAGYNVTYRWRTSSFEGDIVYVRGGYAYYNGVRTVCRDYESTVYYRGRVERTTGVVCRFPDGSIRDVQSVQVSYVQTAPPVQAAQVLSEYQYNDLYNVVRRESFDDSKNRVLNSMTVMYMRQGLLMTYGQLTGILRLFSFDDSKLNALRSVKPMLLGGSGSISDVLAVFTFDDSRQKALRILTN